MNNYIKFISMRAGNFSIALFIVMFLYPIPLWLRVTAPAFTGKA